MLSLKSISLAVVVLALSVFLDTAEADNWPQFRGASFDGIANSDCPTSWDTEKNVAWKVPIAGEGWSAPVIWENRVYLTSAVRTDGGEAKPEPYTNQGGSNRTDLQKVDYRWDVFCLDAKTGKELWRKTAKTGNPPMPRHSTNTYATETPVTDGKHVYAYFGMTGLFCYDMNGKFVWKKDLGSYEMRAGWGTSSSPVLFEDKLFVQVDNEEQSFLVAVDAISGDEVWRVKRDENSQYSSPIIWQNSERAELIVGGMIYRSYDPATGKL
jgi:outer membrane protein assembly factor BamB